MAQSFHRITAGINCFLLPGHDGFALIDTGPAIARRRLVRGIEVAGFDVDDLRRVVVTHGDADHIGSCAYLQETFAAEVALHPLEVRAIEPGDMGTNRKEPPDRMPWFFQLLRPLGAILGKAEPFTPDVLLADGQTLSDLGIDATVLHLPGHSWGSIAVLTDDGNLFAGDLFWNTRRPRLHPLIDDLQAAQASVDRLRALPIRAIHPAHGKSFSADQLPSI